jgi:hypothetical protein
MEEIALPVLTFGKYEGKSVLELLADEKYVVWLKQQSWFSTSPKYKQIYNIVVHQTISTTNNSKTPEHNRLQNLFLDKNNQHKLISKLVKNVKNGLISAINDLFKETDIIRCFGENIMPEFNSNLDNTTIKFEDKYNWDFALYHKDTQEFTTTSNLETELFDKIKYKEQYDIEENEKYDNNLLLIDKLIEYRIKLDQKKKNDYDDKCEKYENDLEKYENDLEIYLQQKPQNEKDISNYENKLKIYRTTRSNFITQQTKLICQELSINYDNFVIWDITNNGYSRLDRDTKHTTKQKKQLQEIVNDKLKQFIKDFEEKNIMPSLVGNLNIPTKPPPPEKYNSNVAVRVYDDEIFKLFKKCEKIKDTSNLLYSVNGLNTYKKDYEDEYIKNYEKKFNEHYEDYRLEYYRDIIKKYCKKYVYVGKTNENQYNISINICEYNLAVCCELKPTLSDDYPNVLRKLKTQIELTKIDNVFVSNRSLCYILLIGSFTSIYVSNEQLIAIFKQSNIKVIFTADIFETSKSVVAIKCVNAEQEENKTLTYNLLQTHEKLLQAEDKIKQLQEEVLLLKSQKQSKTIKDYFGKK